MLYIGENVGKGGKKSYRFNPLEDNYYGKGWSVLAMSFATHGGFLNAPDVYMDKIAVGGGLPEGVVDLDKSIKENLANLSGKNVSILIYFFAYDRPRHAEIINDVRNAGARIMLISDGDVSGVIASAQNETGVDLYVGSGGAPEGVLAAAALRYWWADARTSFV